jgi:hypothetical protein
VFTGVYQEAANCVNGVGGATWRDLAHATAKSGEETTLEVTFDTSTTEVLKVGFRARYTPQPDHAGAGSLFSPPRREWAFMPNIRGDPRLKTEPVSSVGRRGDRSPRSRRLR